MSLFNNFSGQTPYDSLIYQFFNMSYTSLPIIIYAIFDDEYSSQQLLANQRGEYKIGLKSNILKTFILGMCFSKYVFLKWSLDGML